MVKDPGTVCRFIDVEWLGENGSPYAFGVEGGGGDGYSGVLGGANGQSQGSSQPFLDEFLTLACDCLKDGLNFDLFIQNQNTPPKKVSHEPVVEVEVPSEAVARMLGELLEESSSRSEKLRLLLRAGIALGAQRALRILEERQKSSGAPTLLAPVGCVPEMVPDLVLLSPMIAVSPLVDSDSGQPTNHMISLAKSVLMDMWYCGRLNRLAIPGQDPETDLVPGLLPRSALELFRLADARLIVNHSASEGVSGVSPCDTVALACVTSVSALLEAVRNGEPYILDIIKCLPPEVSNQGEQLLASFEAINAWPHTGATPSRFGEFPQGVLRKELAPGPLSLSLPDNPSLAYLDLAHAVLSVDRHLLLSNITMLGIHFMNCAVNSINDWFFSTDECDGSTVLESRLHFEHGIDFYGPSAEVVEALSNFICEHNLPVWDAAFWFCNGLADANGRSATAIVNSAAQFVEDLAGTVEHFAQLPGFGDETMQLKLAFVALGLQGGKSQILACGADAELAACLAANCALSVGGTVMWGIPDAISPDGLTLRTAIPGQWFWEIWNSVASFATGIPPEKDVLNGCRSRLAGMWFWCEWMKYCADNFGAYEVCTSYANEVAGFVRARLREAIQLVADALGLRMLASASNHIEKALLALDEMGDLLLTAERTQAVVVPQVNAIRARVADLKDGGTLALWSQTFENAIGDAVATAVSVVLEGALALMRLDWPADAVQELGALRIRAADLLGRSPPAEAFASLRSWFQAVREWAAGLPGGSSLPGSQNLFDSLEDWQGAFLDNLEKVYADWGFKFETSTRKRPLVEGLEPLHFPAGVRSVATVLDTLYSLLPMVQFPTGFWNQGGFLLRKEEDGLTFSVKEVTTLSSPSKGVELEVEVRFEVSGPDWLPDWAATLFVSLGALIGAFLGPVLIAFGAGSPSFWARLIKAAPVALKSLVGDTGVVQGLAEWLLELESPLRFSCGAELLWRDSVPLVQGRVV